MAGLVLSAVIIFAVGFAAVLEMLWRRQERRDGLR